MAKGLGLTALAQEIERRAASKKDFIVQSNHLHMQSDLTLQFGDVIADVNGIAHKQIAEHLEIPAKYYEKMRAENPALLANNVNSWLGHGKPEARMVRTLDGKARAFLSDKFRPLENEDLAQAVLPALLDIGCEIVSSQITDTKMYIKAVDNRVARELEAKGGKFGDGKHVIVRMLAPAIQISNSEVGHGALSVLAGARDGFCSNLAWFGDRSMRKYHVGGKHELGGEDVYALLSDSTRRVTDAALWAQIGDVVRAAFDRARFDALCDKIAETTEQKIESDPVKAIELTSKRFGINEGESKSILRHLIEGGDLTRFGLYNAVTRTAQDIEDYDRASEFERMGGQIIELPANDFREILKAA
jgi:hypothetical protein